MTSLAIGPAGLAASPRQSRPGVEFQLGAADGQLGRGADELPGRVCHDLQRGERHCLRRRPQLRPRQSGAGPPAALHRGARVRWVSGLRIARGRAVVDRLHRQPRRFVRCVHHGPCVGGGDTWLPGARRHALLQPVVILPAETAACGVSAWCRVCRPASGRIGTGCVRACRT